MTFASPAYFFLLLLLIPYIIWYMLQHIKSTPSIRVSSLNGLHHAPKTWRNYLLHFPFILRLACFVLAVIALARPQTTNNWSTKHTDGIDIMLCMDVSTSMLAEDLKPNRIEAAKEVAIQSITGRPNDNIGLTLFAGEAFTQCPMTVDHAVLLNLLNGMRVDMAQNGMIEDGTAIGMGIAGGVASLGAGLADMGIGYERYKEAKSYAIDMYSYQLGNIKALPTSISKNTALTPNMKIFPFVEKYTCTDTEKQALRDKITYNGMTIMKIGTPNSFVGTGFFKGQIIRLPSLKEDNHMANAIYEEINKGVYL